MIDVSKAVFIDFCSKCDQHAWCTKHNEARYRGFFNLFKEAIEGEMSDLKVYGNTHPIVGKEIPAQLGGFEIIFRKCRVFSKLKSGQWPMVKPVIQIIRDVLEGKFPPGSDFIEYHKIPLDGKKREYYTLPSTQVKPTNPKSRSKGPSSAHDTNTRFFPKNDGSRISLPSATATPRRKFIPSLNSVDPKRPNSSQMPYIYSTHAQSATNKPQTLPMVKPSQYYLGSKCFDGTQRSSAPDVDLTAPLPDGQGPSIIIPTSSHTYLNINDPQSAGLESTSSARPVKANNLVNYYRQQSGGDHNTGKRKMQMQMEQYLDSYSQGLSSVKQQYKHYSKNVTIEQTRDKEINEATVFTVDQGYDILHDGSPSKKGSLKIQWFPDCQRNNSSPDRIGHSAIFDEDLQPMTKTETAKPELKKANVKDGSPANQNKKTLDKRKSFKTAASSNTSSPAKNIPNLKKLVYHEEKLSQIKIAKNKITKKKITLIPDTEKQCKIEVFSSLPRLIAMESNIVTVAKGVPLKISLRFEGKEEEVLGDCEVFLIKDGNPWQKITIDLSFLQK